MIQLRSILTPADNTGAEKLIVIHVFGGNKKIGTLGSVISCVVSGASATGTVKDSEKAIGVVVRVKKEVRRKDGSYIRFDDNAIVVLEKGKKEPRAGRIFGPIPREIQELGYAKIVSLAPEIV